MPWVTFEPLTIEDRRKLIAEWHREWKAGNDVVLGIFLDGVPIGGCGLHRRIGPDGLEIGYWIHADHTRQGYAAEASAALTDLAFTVDGIDRVEIQHDRDNLASRGVPRTLGFELVGEKPAEAVAPPSRPVSTAAGPPPGSSGRSGGRQTTARRTVSTRFAMYASSTGSRLTNAR